MPKSSKAKSPAKKKTVPRAKAKPAARKAAKKTVAPAPKAGHSSFMWKLLERKEAERKARDLAHAKPGHQEDASHVHGDVGHARFAGPRRKAA